MKTLLLFLIAFFLSQIALSQTIPKSSIDNGGATVGNANIQIVYTLGEVNVSEVTVGNIRISEGFIGASQGISAIWYADSDEDAFGDPNTILYAAIQPIGYVADSSDCDDNRADIYPGATEIPDNEVDEDCDSFDAKTWYADTDGDGFGDPNSSQIENEQPPDYVADNTDCNDNDVAVNPGATDIPNNGIDENCDGSDVSIWFTDGGIFNSIDNGGAIFNSGNIQILYTIGEVNVREVTVVNVSISEGFIGPNLYSSGIYIPDANFEQALIDLGFDTDGNINQQISKVDAEAATSLDVHSKEIISLEGIEGFINLDYLYCGYNALEELNVSKNTKLTTLICHNNSLSELDVSKNVLLKSLNCQKNIISELDVTALANLNYLDCDRNIISNLDVSNNPVLAHLRCSNNQLNELNVENNPLLNLLDCIENDISELNLLSNPELEQLRCKSNEINELILTNNPKLFKLECTGNNLQELDLSNNLLISELICMFNEIEILEVSHLENLTRLFCTWNKISDLDLRDNKLLYQLDCSYNILLTLDLRSGTNDIINRFDASNNEYLSCISVDDELANHSGWIVNTGVIFSNDCGYNTQRGVEVKVALLDKITSEKTAEVTFDDVEASGETTIEVTKEVVSIGSINLNEEKTVYNIETTAEYEGDIDIIIDYAKEDIVNEDGIRLFHKKGETWEDVTTSVDQENDEVHGTTSSLSPFIIVEDVVDPTIVCISDVTQDTDEGLCAAVVNGIAPIEFNDNIGVAGVTYEISGATIASGHDDASGTTFNYGISTVTYTVSDVAGNTSTCSFDVTVTSNLPNHVYVIEASTPDPIQAGTHFSLYADFNANNLTSGIWYFSNDGEINHPSDAEFSFIGDISGGIVSGTFNFAAVDAGVYAVKLVVVDACGQTAEAIYNYVVIFDPTGGFVTGGGWIHSPEGALVGTTHVGKAKFGLVAKYKKGKNNMNEVDGNTNFRFKEGDFHFKSSSYDDMSLVISGERKATYKGSGSVNGTGYYDFLVTVVDGEAPGAGQGDIDTFRIKIWTSGAPSDVIYDNELGTAENSDANTGLGGGSIVIHKPKGNSKNAKISDSKFESIGEELITELNVVYWPNPTDGYFNIKLETENGVDKVNIYVFDLNNRLVHVDEFDVKQQYQFGNRLQSGIYFVKLLQANNSKTIRVIKY